MSQDEEVTSSPDVPILAPQNEPMQLAATAAPATVATARTNNGAQAPGVQINRPGRPTIEQAELNKAEALRLQNNANNRHSARLRSKVFFVIFCLACPLFWFLRFFSHLWEKIPENLQKWFYIGAIQT
jgi:hypothetical protein